MELLQVSEILGGEDVLGRCIENRMDLVELGNQGVTKDAVSHLANYLSLSLKQVADLLPVTERTLQRYSQKDHLNTTVSEQVLQIAEVIARGEEVFGDKDKFLSWMAQPNTALSDRVPLSLLDSRFGTEMVLDELGRLEYGVYS